MSQSQSYSQDFLSTVFSGITDPLHIVDRNFRLVWTNKEAEASLIGLICYSALFGFDSICPNCPVQTVFDTGKACVKEKSVKMPDDSTSWFEVRAYPIFDKGAGPQLVATIGRDITDKKNAEVAENATTKQTALNLTKRQTEVLKLIAQGLTNIEIADKLHISPHTVKRHITNLFNTLNVGDRTQAAILAVKHGLI